MNREQNRRSDCTTGLCGGPSPCSFPSQKAFFTEDNTEKSRRTRKSTQCVSLGEVISVACALQHGKKDNRRIKVCLAWEK